MDKPLVLQVMGVGVRLVPAGSGARALDSEIRRVWERCLVAEAVAGEEQVELQVWLDDDAEVVAEALTSVLDDLAGHDLVEWD